MHPCHGWLATIMWKIRTDTCAQLLDLRVLSDGPFELHPKFALSHSEGVTSEVCSVSSSVLVRSCSPMLGFSVALSMPRLLRERH